MRPLVRVAAAFLLLLSIGLQALPAAAQSPDSADSSTVDSDTRFSRVDPHAHRLFYSSTARPLERGAVSVSVTNVFLPQVAVGITDAISVEAGALANAELFLLMPSVRLAERDRLQISVSARAYVAKETGLSFNSQPGGFFRVEALEDWRYGVTPRALLTYGTDAASLTTSIGTPIASRGLYDDPRSGFLTLSVGGSLQVLNWLKFIAENEATIGAPYRELSAEGRTTVLESLAGARFFWDHFAIDLGVGVQAATLDRIDSGAVLHLRFDYLF